MGLGAIGLTANGQWRSLSVSESLRAVNSSLTLPARWGSSFHILIVPFSDSTSNSSYIMMVLLSILPIHLSGSFMP
ncbi:argonaute-like protein [Moniliophthora roreri]|nr:argonaute-like protein [Moniliophthora roreri]